MPGTKNRNSDSETVLLAKNITKTYAMGKTQVHALCGIDLGIRKGEYISIMGPSGSGKTTLLDVISCLLRPSSGEVYIKGKPISKMPDNELAQIRGRTIGFVFQTFNLIPRLNAVENVSLPLWFQGIPKEKREETAKRLLAQVGLAERMMHRPDELSGGQMQKVAIARALAVNPDVIVADEPTGNLDSASGEIVLGMIDDLHYNENKTIVMVTHERDVAQRAERILHLKDGEIARDERNHKRLGKYAKG
ncbi:MAG: ABC transporter ATP-binding protein [Candidatus Diapherotrites archaeon]|nr:ABC transporter ATP-binding protein [Candidatus Diapherotrites archaeon]